MAPAQLINRALQSKVVPASAFSRQMLNDNKDLVWISNFSSLQLSQSMPAAAFDLTSGLKTMGQLKKTA